MQEEFQPMIEHALYLCVSHFGDRLRSVILGGSVAFGEALAGASDVDWFMFVNEEPTESDIRWREETKTKLDRHYSIITEFGLGLYSIDRLRNEDFWRFIIKYNSVKLYGTDIISELESEGISTPEPTNELIKSRLTWMESMWISTCEGKIPEMLFKTPDDPLLASRKIARQFVIVEGAYLLMLDNDFVSFRQNDVLQQLRGKYPQWENVYRLTERVAINPTEACIMPESLIVEIKPFVNWMIERIKDA